MFEGGDGTSYDVAIKLHKVGDGWDDMSAGIGKFSSAIDGVVGKLASIGSWGALAAGTAAVGALTYGVMNLNAHAEGAAISLGTIFSVNGMAANVPAGITMAADTIAKMRVDAQKLPGEFEDLQNIFTMGATSAFRSGLSIDKWREMSANAMAAGAVLQMPMDQVAREMTQLMEGHAGSHNVFGSKLGFTGDRAKSLNAMDMVSRDAAIGAELTKFAGSLDVFAKSWDGLSSTFIDHVKDFARAGTGPLFESLKGTLFEVNKWFDANSDQVNRFAMRLGSGIQDAFEWGKKKVIEWYPIVENFVEVAYNRFKDFWAGIEPYVSSFAKAFKDALSDPNGTIDKLQTLLELYLAAKGIGVGYDIGKTALGGANAIGSLLGGVGGKAASAAASGVTRGVGMEFGEIALGGGAAEAGTALTGLGASTAVAGGVFLAALAAWGVAIYEGVDLWNEIKEQQLADTQAIATAHGVEIAGMMRAGESWEQINTQIQDSAGDYVDNMDATGWAMNDVATGAAYAANGLDALGDKLSEVTGKQASDSAAEQANRDSGMANYMAVMGKALVVDAGNAAAKAKPTMKGGHGGTHIQKVEIVVTSNQTPSRIARQVRSELVKVSTNRRVSPQVPNFSNYEEG